MAVFNVESAHGMVPEIPFEAPGPRLSEGGVINLSLDIISNTQACLVYDFLVKRGFRHKGRIGFLFEAGETLVVDLNLKQYWSTKGFPGSDVDSIPCTSRGDLMKMVEAFLTLSRK